MSPVKRLLVIILLIGAPHLCGAQGYLNKGVSVKAQDKTIEAVLHIIAKQGGFYFSYNSKLVNADSVISVNIWNKTVSQALDMIFGKRFVYKETPNHVIIQSPDAGQFWYVSGYIVDEQTGERVRDVSVFESSQLVASLTNDQGYFRLKLKDKIPSTTINISKSLYRDTLISIKPGVNQEVKVKIQPKPVELDPVVISSNDNFVEGTWFGKMFLSSKQRIQSLNLNKFFVDMPFQGSVIPGVSSQGKMASQMVNSVSLNMIGGYTAGVKGLEVGTVFNVVKKDAKYVQVAGILNIVGGNVMGVQAAGIHNNVLDTMTGVQLAGISNLTRRAVTGIQAGGIYNLSGERLTGVQLSGLINNAIDTVVGVQAAGIVNMTVKKITGGQLAGVVNTSVKGVEGIQAAGIINAAIKDVTGAQVSGMVNFTAGTVNGLQATSLLNYATKVKGVQIGLVNIADTMSGVPVGLFSFVLKGHHRVVVSANETTPLNFDIKTGTRWLYNIYSAGTNLPGSDKAYRLGYGFGSELPLSERFSVSPELTGNIIYLGDWAEINSLVRFQANLNVHFGKFITVFGGPSYNMYWDNRQPKVGDFATEILPANYKRNIYNANLSSWIGWTAGIAFF